MIEFIKKIFSSGDGVPSSKRLVGIVGAFSLVINMFVNNKQYSVDAVLIISLGALGISGIESIFKPKQ